VGVRDDGGELIGRQILATEAEHIGLDTGRHQAISASRIPAPVVCSAMDSQTLRASASSTPCCSRNPVPRWRC
jgi:hypothetical protein